MNKNITGIILIILAVGLFFTFTQKEYDKVKVIQVENTKLAQAVKDADELIRRRDEVIKAYNAVPKQDRDNLNKMLPDHVDNIRLIIDLNGITSAYGSTIRNVKTTAVSGVDKSSAGAGANAIAAPLGVNQGSQTMIVPHSGQTLGYDSVTVSFTVTATYDTFLKILRDLEKSLRIIDVTRIGFNLADPTAAGGANRGGAYDFNVEVKTYWLRQ